MLRLYLLLLAVIMLSFNLTGQEIKLGEFNPEFIKYQKLVKSVPKAEQRFYGFVPPPLWVKSGSPAVIRTDLPGQYDMRLEGLMSAVQDQLNTPLCWAYSAYGALESQFIKEGNENLDLSEECLQNWKRHYFENDEGGNYQMVDAYLSTGKGPLPEQLSFVCDKNLWQKMRSANVSYNSTDAIGSSGSPDGTVLKAGRREDLIMLLKNMVYTMGAVNSTLYFDNRYYNNKDYTYFCDTTDIVINHAVVLAGWNDTIKTAADDLGAWIVKNSWGKSWGDSGYFYLSYYDSLAYGYNSIWSNIVRDDTTAVWYMHDKLGGLFGMGYTGRTEAYGLAKFEAIGGKALTRVQTWTLAPNTIVRGAVYDDFNGTSKGNMLREFRDTVKEFAGYSFYELPSPLFLDDGDDFYVEIRYQNPDTLTPPVPCELKVTDYCDPPIETGRYWISLDGVNYTKLGADTDYKENLAIRGYGNDTRPEWTALESGVSEHLRDICFTDNWTGFACGDNGLIIKTTDGGVSWKPLVSGSVYNLNGIFFTDANTGWVCGANGRMYKTTDAGESWQVQTSYTNNILYDIKFKDEMHGYAAGGLGRVFVTTDGGGSWTGYRAGTGYDLKYIGFGEGDDVWVCGEGGIISKSSNGGVTWTLKNSGVTGRIGGMWTGEGGLMLAAAAGGVLLRSRDGGESWSAEEQEMRLDFYSIWFMGQTGFLTGDKGIIMVSRDGGENWEYVSSAGKEPLYAGAATGRMVFAAGGSGRVLRWREILIDVNEPAAEAVTFELKQNYPNPFNAVTKIKYEVPEAGRVVLKVYDVLGRETAVLEEGYKDKGEHECRFDAAVLSSGIYFYSLISGGNAVCRKMVVLK